MDLKAMCVDELVVFLSSKGISKEICEQLEENAIDGQTLGALIDDNDEFVSVIPKGGHRLQLKKVVKALVDIEEEKDKSDLTTSMTFSPDNALKTIPSKPISNTPSKPIVMQTLDFCGFEVRNEECAESCEQKTGKEKCNYQSDKSPNSVDTLPQNLPFPERLSIKVEAAINNGSVASERTQLIADIGTFYFGLSHHPRQGDYKRIAILVCERFPELRDSNPSNYWVSIQRQLSQYFRNLRRRTAVKASICDNTKESSAKKAKLSASVQDDEQTQRQNLELLRDAKKGSMSTKTYVGLFEDTFHYRRTFVQTLVTSATEVLQMCPYFSEPKFLRKEVFRMLGRDEKVKDHVNDAKLSLKQAFNIAMNHAKDYDMSSEELINAVELVERKTKNKKGLHTSILKFKDPSTKPDVLFKDKIVQFRLVALGSPSKIEQLFIAGEDQAFVECENDDLLSAFVDLIAAYYVFDVKYPDSMAGFLLFLQDIALKATDNVYRGTKYSAFMSKLRV